MAKKLLSIMALLLIALSGIASAQVWNPGTSWNSNQGTWNQPTGSTPNSGGTQSGASLPITVDEVEVDGTTLAEDQVNRLSIERSDEFKVKVTFTGTGSHDNVVIQGFISGYEHDSVSDMVGPFDIEDDTTYTKTLTLSLPKDIEEDSYKLRIMFSDRNGEEIFLNYNLKVDEKRHSIEVTDVILYPETSITAGSALLTSVRVENFGQRDENDIKVEVEILALGLSATDYIDEVEQGAQEETEELYLRIPQATKAGDYEMVITAWYNDGRDSVESTKLIHVDADASYQDSVAPKNQIVVGSTLENVKQGESVIFPITVTNTARTDVAYSLAVAGAADWADVTISPTTTQVVKAGESKTFHVRIAVKDDAAEGSHVFTATVSSGNQQVEQIALTANVIESRSIWGTLAKVVGIAIVVVLVLFIVMAVYNRMQDGDKPEAQTYY